MQSLTRKDTQEPWELNGTLSFGSELPHLKEVPKWFHSTLVISCCIAGNCVKQLYKTFGKGSLLSMSLA
jgi:hypothetical protein